MSSLHVTWLELLGFGGDRAECDPQRARCQHGAGGARDHRAGDSFGLSEPDLGLDQRPRHSGRQPVVDLEPHWAAGAERKTAVIGGEDLYLEADIPASDSALQSGSGPGLQAFARCVVGGERDRRPAPARGRIGKHSEHVRGLCGRGLG